MRVLLTTDTIGGVWMFTEELAKELLRRGHQVALFSLGRRPSASQSEACESLAQQYGSAFRYVPCEAPLEWMSANECAYEQPASLLERLAEEFAADIFHTSQFCFGALPLSIPKLITAHSDVLSWAEACKPQGLQQSAWLDRYISLVQDGLACADAVAAPTAWMLAAVKSNFATPPVERVILNGRSVPAADTIRPRKLQAVSAGRLWDEAKNLFLLTRIKSPMPIFVAGEERHEAASAPAWGGGIRTLGVLDQEALLHLFGTSSLYIVTSVYEPFGLAPLDAALCGCAILANDLLSLREVWGDAALYFHDASSLKSLLCALVACPEMLARASLSAFRRAQELTASRMADAYSELYANLMHAPRYRSEMELTTHAR